MAERLPEPQQVPTAYNFPLSLKIVKQTATESRFRFPGEHNSCLHGIRSTRKCPTYPTIRLDNFIGKVHLTASLYTSDHLRRHLHYFRGKDCCDGVYLKDVCIPEGGLEVGFPNLYITCVAKKLVLATLRAQYIADMQGRELVEAEEEQLVKDAEYMTTNLNTVVLCFEAHMCLENIGSFIQICEPVFSNPIKDLRAAEQLTIVHNTLPSGQASGGDEMVLLTKRVKKTDIEVVFYDSDGWETCIAGTDCYVHHQFAIKLLVPPYANRNIRNPVNVSLELRQRSDPTKFGNTLQFTYIPDIKAQVLQKREQKTPNPQHLAVLQAKRRKTSDENLNYSNISVAPENLLVVEPSTSQMTMLAGDFRNTTFVCHEVDAPCPPSYGSDPFLPLPQEQPDDQQQLTSPAMNPMGNDALDCPVQAQEMSPKLDLPILSLFDDLEEDSAVPPKRRSNAEDHSQLVSRGPSTNSNTEVFSCVPTSLSCEPDIEDINDLMALCGIKEKGSIGSFDTKELQLQLAIEQSLLETKKDTGKNEKNTDKAFGWPSKSCSLNSKCGLYDIVQATETNRIDDLLQNQAAFRELDCRGNSILHVAARENQPEIITAIRDFVNGQQLIQELVAPVLDLYNYEGHTALHLAVLARSPKMVEQLCISGCDVNSPVTTNGQTALHLAISGGCWDILKLLLSQVAVDVNVQDFSRNTPLHLACMKKKATAVELLMQAQADPHITNGEESEVSNVDGIDKDGNGEYGKDCFEVAEGDPKILKLLHSHAPTRMPLQLEGARRIHDSSKQGNLSSPSATMTADGSAEWKSASSKLNSAIIQQLADLLDPPGRKNWQVLLKTQGKMDLIEVCEQAASPTKLLLELIEPNELYNGLQDLGLMEPLQQIIEFLCQKRETEQRSQQETTVQPSSLAIKA